MMTFNNCKLFNASGFLVSSADRVTFSDDTVLINATSHPRHDLTINWATGKITSPNGWSVEFDRDQHADFADAEQAFQDAANGYGDDLAALPDEVI